MKKIFFILLFILVFVVPCSALTYYDDNGFYTFESSSYDPTLNNWFPLSSPVYPDSVTIPSNYSPIGYVATHNNTYRFNIWLYADISNGYPIFTIQGSSSGFSIRSTGDNVFSINNRFSKNDTTGDTRVFNLSQTNQPYSQSGDCKVCFFVPVVDSNGNIIQPETLVNFSLNCVYDSSNYSIHFNSVLNSGNGTGVDYYIFPASANIPTGSLQSVVDLENVANLSDSQKETVRVNGFGQLIHNIFDNDTAINSIVNYIEFKRSMSTPTNSVFDPDSFNVPYVLLGHRPLFNSSGSGITVSGNLDLKYILSHDTGVYAYSPLQLVAVCKVDNKSFIASYSFNPSSLVGSSPVPPTSTEGSVSFPSFGDDTSQFKDLADYLKDLFNTNQENMVRNNNNFIANLMAIPWANFVGTGFSAKLPELSFYLDSLFDSLFDKFTAPTDEQINALYEDIQIERNGIKAKLAFASDVKAELYFIISTITADNNSVPPRFEINLPSSLFGGHQVRTVDLMSYEIATPYVVGIIKDIITVFLSLGLVLHVWRTLPSTIGNMPRGDE